MQRLYRRASIVVLTFAMLGAFTATAAPAGATTTGSERLMASYLNHGRTSRGIPALRLNSSLSDLARKHSAQMARAKTIFHTSNLAYTLRSYSWRYAGENVGMGPRLDVLYRAFMNSTSHRANILSRRFQYVGVGIVWRDGVAYCTQVFIGR